ncbi:MAG TPA: menaquinone biosynthesis protein [Luteitalea sp.]|nr:menaquinone biosynthesis protein [Luteitalea sp.]
MTRIGAVGFLNARPLTRGLAEDPQVSVRFDVPSECARLLHAGEIDLGLVPAIELLRGPVTYDIVPGLAIGCDGPVNSVALFTRRPIAEVTSVALDISSRSSVALFRVLAQHHFAIDPAYVDAPPDLGPMLEVADAALLIGDPALRAPWQELGLEKHDLGAAWKTLTGLPFVFAVWAAWPGQATADVVNRLEAARRDGTTAIPLLAAEEAEAGGGDAARLEQYLRRNIRYDLDDEALRGLSRYLTLAAQAGLVDARPEVLQVIEGLRGGVARA